MTHCTLSKNASAFMPRSIVLPLLVLALGCGLVGFGTLDAQAQSQRSQQAPAQQRAAPEQGRAPAGSQGPPATRPSNPSSSLGPSPGGANTPGGTAQTNNGPGTPDDPSQTPLGGAEWLAAAGAAYALNRLRDDESDEDDDEDA
jgi:hypothetical protein